MEQLKLLDLPPDGPDALTYFSETEDLERGEVFTRREVVEFILDLTRWDDAANLSHSRLLEPSAGSFVSVCVDALCRVSHGIPIFGAL